MPARPPLPTVESRDTTDGGRGMVDMTLISGGYAALKAAKDAAQSLIGLHTAQAVNAKALELQGHLLDAHSTMATMHQEHTTLVARVAELENQIARLEEWEAEAVRYELKEVAPGALAYSVKEEARGTEPPHHLCPNCYASRKKSFLQTIDIATGRATVLVCNTCGPITYTSGAAMESHATLLKSLRK